MEDGDAAYASYAVLHLNYRPQEWLQLPQKEKAFVIACISGKVKAERDAIAKANSKR